MNKEQIISETENHVKKVFKDEGSGHDWFHVDRVRKLSVIIGKEEGADLFITELAALLHDLDDWKLKNAENDSFNETEGWLKKLNLPKDFIRQIIAIISEVSYKGASVETQATSTEAKVVQDADRIDAIGAIGIARTFAYGGNKNRIIYDPDIAPIAHSDFESYKKSNSPTINHFYEKLLLLKNRMNTSTAKLIAEERHSFMENFLKQFYREWDVSNEINNNNLNHHEN